MRMKIYQYMKVLKTFKWSDTMASSSNRNKKYMNFLCGIKKKKTYQKFERNKI